MMTSTWTRNVIDGSTIDNLLGIDLQDQWNQLDEQFAGLHALASSFVPSKPTNEVTGRAYRCLGLVA